MEKYAKLCNEAVGTKKKEKVTKSRGMQRSGRTTKLLQEGHPRQVQDEEGKEGAGHSQEAKHQNNWHTKTRKDQEAADS